MKKKRTKHTCYSCSNSITRSHSLSHTHFFAFILQPCRSLALPLRPLSVLRTPAPSLSRSLLFSLFLIWTQFCPGSLYSLIFSPCALLHFIGFLDPFSPLHQSHRCPIKFRREKTRTKESESEIKSASERVKTHIETLSLKMLFISSCALLHYPIELVHVRLRIASTLTQSTWILSENAFTIYSPIQTMEWKRTSNAGNTMSSVRISMARENTTTTTATTNRSNNEDTRTKCKNEHSNLVSIRHQYFFLSALLLCRTQQYSIIAFISFSSFFHLVIFFFFFFRTH